MKLSRSLVSRTSKMSQENNLAYKTTQPCFDWARSIITTNQDISRPSTTLSCSINQVLGCNRDLANPVEAGRCMYKYITMTCLFPWYDLNSTLLSCLILVLAFSVLDICRHLGQDKPFNILRPYSRTLTKTSWMSTVHCTVSVRVFVILCALAISGVNTSRQPHLDSTPKPTTCRLRMTATLSWQNALPRDVCCSLAQPARAASSHLNL